MFRADEDISAALRLLLTPRQVALLTRTGGRSRKQLLQLLLNDGYRWRREHWREMNLRWERGQAPFPKSSATWREELRNEDATQDSEAL